jgi:hypothetical protein
MKLRKRKKAYDCSHHVHEDFLVTDDPYPIYNTEDYCKLGKYDNTWASQGYKAVSLCEHCKRFRASRPMIRKQREKKALNKELERYWNRNYSAAVRAGVVQDDLNLDLVL